jgi:ELWxxDGT repeat protein
MTRLILFCFLAIQSFATNLSAQAKKVADINPNGSDKVFDLIQLADNRVVFSANDGIHGAELWVSDGTTTGTELIRDMVVGSNSSTELYRVLELNKSFFFKSTVDSLRLFQLNTSSMVVEQKLAFASAGVFFGVPLSVGKKMILPVSFSIPAPGVSYIDFFSVDTETGIVEKFAQLPTGGLLSARLSLAGKAFFVRNRSEIWQTDGTANLFSKLVTVDTSLRISHLLESGNAFLGLASRSDSTIHSFTFSSNGVIQKRDSLKLIDRSGFSYLTLINGKLYSFGTAGLIIVDPLSGDLDKNPAPIWQPTLDLNSTPIICGQKLYFHGQASPTNSTATLYTYDLANSTYQKVIQRPYAVTYAEQSYCYNNSLMGEWSVASNENGVFVLLNGVDSLYFSSGCGSSDVLLSGNKLLWIGPDNGGCAGGLWSLDLTTVPTTEPLPAQLDLSVYPTITTDGVFYLGGTDAQTDLMSAQLVNSAGSIIHVNTQVSTGEPLNFGTKAPGVYFVYLLSKDGRRFMQKVVYR